MKAPGKDLLSPLAADEPTPAPKRNKRGGNLEVIDPPIAGSSEPDFDWAKDPDIVVTARPANAIYENRKGHVVVRQEARPYGDDDPFITIGPEFLDDVITRLVEFRKPR
jgi:hypothetical protein